MNSSRNIRIAEAIDDGIDGPNTQTVVCSGGQLTPGARLSQTSITRSRSLERPSPSSMRRRTFSSQ